MSNLSELRELNKNNEREKIVIKTSVIGIITNVFWRRSRLALDYFLIRLLLFSMR